MVEADKIKWSKNIEQFIINKMIIDKLLPGQIFQKFPDKLPSQRTYERKRASDQNFAEQINMAYGVIFDYYHSQLEEISTFTPIEAYLYYGKAQSREEVDFRDAREFYATRIRVLTTYITTISGVFSKKYDKKQQVEVKQEVETKHVFVFPDFAQQYIDSKIIDAE